MPVEVFEKIAADMFPKAWRVALGLRRRADDPSEVQARSSAIAGRYGIPDLWFPTNLLALTEPTAQALISGAGDDGRRVDRRDDEGDLREDPRARKMGAAPRLPRHVPPGADGGAVEEAEAPDHLHVDAVEPRDLQLLPEFAAGHGAVRARRAVRVADARRRRQAGAALGRRPRGRSTPSSRRPRRARPCGEESSSRPIPSSSRPASRQGRPRAHAPPDLAPPRRARPARVLALLLVPGPLRLRLSGPQLRHPAQRRGQPVHLLGADPIGFYPADGLERIAGRSAPEAHPRRAALRANPIGTCATCGERRTALYRLRGTPAPETRPPRASPRTRAEAHRRRAGLGFLSSCAGRGIRPPAPFRAGRRGRSSPG